MIDYPTIQGQKVTREEIMNNLWYSYNQLVEHEKKIDPSFVRFPDMELLLHWIDINGIPPKQL